MIYVFAIIGALTVALGLALFFREVILAPWLDTPGELDYLRKKVWALEDKIQATKKK